MKIAAIRKTVFAFILIAALAAGNLYIVKAADDTPAASDGSAAYTVEEPAAAVPEEEVSNTE